MTMRVELLWFEDCPNHETAESMLRSVLDEYGVRAEIQRIEVADERKGDEVRFPGSPTIRINGLDIEPGWEDCEDCTPRCRLYATSEGLRGVPERAWIGEAAEAALAV